MADITTISPITQEAIAKHASLKTSEFPAILSAAETAFRSFKKTTLSERQQIIRNFCKLLLENKDELAREITEQMGRPIRYTPKEIETAVKRAEYMLKISDEVLKSRVVDDGKLYVSREPVGVIMVVFAWNVSGIGIHESSRRS